MNKFFKMIKYKLFGFNQKQLYEIIDGKDYNIDVSLYEKPEFDGYQMREIKLGLISNLDVSYYLNPDFTHWEMNEIRLGLADGLDVSLYSKPEFDYLQMEQIRYGLNNHMNPKYFVNKSYLKDKIKDIINCNVNPKSFKLKNEELYSQEQLKELRFGYLQDLDISIYANEDISAENMLKIREELLEEKLANC